MKALKIGAGALLALVVVAVVGVMVMVSRGNARLERRWDEVKGVDVPVPWPLDEPELAALREAKKQELQAKAATAAAGEAAPLPADADLLAGVDLVAIAKERALARGKHLIEARGGCADCHGADFGGKVIIDAPPMGVWASPNITMGGNAKNLAPADWDRIVRHGVAKDGTSATMPAIDYTGMSDRELSDIITFITSAPPVDKPNIENKMGPVRGVLIATGGIPVAAELIDHGAGHPKVPPDEAVTLEFGKHVASGCVGCHGLNFAGGPVPGGDPKWPDAANLTPDASGLAGWTAADFRTLAREGKSKDGREMQEPMKGITAAMRAMTDTELDATFLFLQSLPPLAKGAATAP
ncbi:MAG: c-type cytochrome [Deltaproteobacteria bacterium]|nr:c-type cytochrome [Deltaproteobacteria bacterium]